MFPHIFMISLDVTMLYFSFALFIADSTLFLLQLHCIPFIHRRIIIIIIIMMIVSIIKICLYDIIYMSNYIQDDCAYSLRYTTQYQT